MNLKSEGIKTLIFRILSMLSQFYFIKLIFNLLHPEEYEFWVLATTIFPFLMLFDFGIASSVRNRVPEFPGEKLAINYAATVFLKYLFKIILINITVFLIILCANENFNVFKETKFFWLYLLMTIGFSFCVICQILIAYFVGSGNPSKAIEISAVTHSLNAVLLYALLAFGVINISLSFICVLYLFTSITTPFIYFGLKLKKVGKVKVQQSAKEEKIDRSHINFFIIQISYVLMFFSDKWIISFLFDPILLSTFDVYSRLYLAGSTIWTAILQIYWSKMRIDVVNKNVTSVRYDINFLHVLLAVSIFVALVLTMIAEDLIWLWLQVSIRDIQKLEYALFFSTSMGMCAALYAIILNSYADMKTQTFVSVTTAVLNIPLSFLISSVFQVGPVGVPVATGVLLLITSVILRQRVRKIHA